MQGTQSIERIRKQRVAASERNPERWVDQTKRNVFKRERQDARSEARNIKRGA